MKLRVKRSLTIKQMAAVTGVTLVTIAIFITIQLCHFIQQRKDDYISQLNNAAVQVQAPLTEALLNSDLSKAKELLIGLRTVGILGRADVVLPEDIRVIRLSFATHRPIPELAKRVFGIPVEVSIPLHVYGSVSTDAKPLGHLILQVDSNRVYRFAINTLALMLTTYLLLALILTVSISWCINRIIVHPLRDIARDLNNDQPSEPMACPKYHQDDELGLLIRGYNRQFNKHKPPSS
ncbi:membrane protein [Photorhabdus luminescens subsp. luminescens]|uniref:HAMP domain-containing protein n=2 Tax=Photorhabdus luminescens TaxID=29488 RepID=A0A1G5QFB1_PHOLU|nr:HAMP domain-containing protein [Photorhabdus luminescens]KMW72612.1 membrane protein [Photorhabdus luminescens subsp. luminescens]MCW7761208.1 HAMP domain-containing protein [Photorhabdus luminescens subsp. venezuelensis]OWO79223.1 HAMP domain-containing protein [Photorhabdus luminescens]TDB45448.1 HAMP domain-containing protein [Photorhabdus luminescens subsp. mexicana]SCZ60484.1 HAMP domain-containing protein [Photorhabdus luminescens]